MAPPPAPSGQVQRITVRGNERIEPATVMSYLPIQAGYTIDSSRIDLALKALFRTDLFSDVKIDFQEGELIVTVVLMGLMAAIGSSVIADSFTTARIINTTHAVSSEARYSMERIAREIREIQYTGSAYVTTNMGATNFVFTRSDGVIVTIDKTGANLTLAYSTLPGVTATLSNKVDSSGFTLTYLDVDGAAATASTLRFVQITLTVTDSATGFTNTLREELRRYADEKKVAVV